MTFDVVPQDQAKVDEAGEPPDLSAKIPGCPHASTSSSLDSVKADIESTSKRPFVIRVPSLVFFAL